MGEMQELPRAFEIKGKVESVSDTTKKIRFGILGTGWMADIFAKELALSEDATLTAVASSTPGRAASFSNVHSAARPFDSYEALIAWEGIDIVYIATTTERHLENAMTCIDHGRPMLVEKPLTLCADDTRKVVAAAKARGLFCMEAMWMRCFPQIRDLEAVLAPIGPVQKLEASFCIDIPFDPTHRLYNPDLGGGALLDIGIYPLNLVHRLWGFENAEMSFRLEWAKSGVDEAGVITFDYSDGRHAALDYSLKGQRPHRARFHGQTGTVTIENFFHPSKIIVALGDGTIAEEAFSYPVMGYQYEIDEVVRSIKTGRLESALVPHRTAIEIAEMMDRILLLGKRRQ